MSKIGNKPVSVESGVEVALTGDVLTVKGSGNTLEVNIPLGIMVAIENGVITVTRTREDKKTRSLHGLIRSLISNAVVGVTTSWKKNLQIVGTGYRARVEGETLVLEVGFSHPVKFEKIEGVTYAVKGNLITISGPDKQLVGEVAHKIKKIRKPDAYKGKGIRYEGEVIKLKPGKKAKTA